MHQAHMHLDKRAGLPLGEEMLALDDGLQHNRKAHLQQLLAQIPEKTRRCSQGSGNGWSTGKHRTSNQSRTGSQDTDRHSSDWP